MSQDSHESPYYSCFISYSSQDTAFAEKLHADLEAAGVECWFAPEDLAIGQRVRNALDTAILARRKLLLILSEHSTASDWVEQEAETAFEKERDSGETVLFPLRLDDTVFNLNVGWAAHIQRTRHIGDFRNWRDPKRYQSSLQRVLRDLAI
jgi:hypothetical protein